MANIRGFFRLPYELRARIWKMTVEPRTVNVEIRHENHYCASGPYLASSTPVPAVLQVCQEARNYGLYQKTFSEIAIPGKGLRYVWANLEIDMIDIGISYFKDFEPVAPTIRRLKFEREAESEFFFHRESDEIRNFVNVKEIYVVCADGLYAWTGAFEGIYWPCDEENVFFIDPEDSERVFRGHKGLDMICEIAEREFQEREAQQRGD